MIAQLTQSLQKNAKFERGGSIEVARTELSLKERMKALQDSTKQWEQKEARPRIPRQSSIKAIVKELPILTQNPAKRERSSAPVNISISSGLNKFFNGPGPSTVNSVSCDIDTVDLDAITSNSVPLKTPMRVRAPNRKRAGGNGNAIDERIRLETVKIDETKFVEEDEEPEKLETQEKAIAAIKNAKQLLKSPPKKSTYPEVMLIQVRGFKHCDVRLVAPLMSSIHENACFIVVHKNNLIRYEGSNANVIERTKASQLCYEICNKSDLNCSAGKVDFIDYNQKSSLAKLLINSENYDIKEANNNDRMDCGLYSNENFEITAARLNLVLRIAEDRTAQTFSRKEKLSVEILQPDETLIFDFGSEIYVWSGRNSSKIKSVYATEYGKQLLSKSIKNGKMIIGDVESDEKRPDWTLFRKLHQGVRNTLFEAKFYDWEESKKVPTACIPRPVFKQKKPDVKSYDEVKLNEDDEVEALTRRILKKRNEEFEPILILEDQEIDRKMRDVITEQLTLWHLLGEELKNMEFTNEFDSAKCYVLKWTYRIQKSGVRRMKTGVEEERETGRSRVAYFYWLGEKTKSKQHGLCAYRIKDLDKENSPRIRIDEGNEPALFLALFEGMFLVRCTPSTSQKMRFVVCGANSEESSLREIENLDEKLRSHAAYIEVKDSDEPIIVCGANCAPEQVKLVLKHAERFQTPASCSKDVRVEVEGDVANRKFINSTGRKHAMKVWRLFDNEAEQVNHLSGHFDCSFTFSQNILSDTILIDVGDALWMWSDDVVTTFALKVADKYWKGRNGKMVVVYKGFEPEEFQALFLKWTKSDEGNENGSEPKDLKTLLSERCRYFSMEELQNRENLPAGMDMRRLESYLSDENFRKTFKMDRNEFYEQKSWKQNEARKRVGLF